MSDRRASQPRPPTGRRRYQFGVWVWFPAALLVSVVMAAVAGMLRDDTADESLPRVFFILMAAAIPIGMLLLVSLLRLIFTRGPRRGRRRRA